MFNYGVNTTLVADLHTTEYRFLQVVPEHRNIVAVLGVLPACALTADIVDRLPPAAREAASQVNHRTKATRYRSTTGMLLERLPLTLEALVKQLGADLDAPLIAALAVQVLAALHHLNDHGVVHADIKPNNIMVDPRCADRPPRST